MRLYFIDKEVDHRPIYLLKTNDQLTYKYILHGFKLGLVDIRM